MVECMKKVPTIVMIACHRLMGGWDCRTDAIDGRISAITATNVLRVMHDAKCSARVCLSRAAFA